MGLAEYRRKRTFSRTPEPAGKKPAARRKARSLFVVQKHAASRLHYDFRLESEGVLKSWAVPKGPSLDPADKRLAVEVEDHPLEYGEFEGTIPEGEYGGGRVLLWDRGDWEPEGSAAEGLRRGRLKFRLNGEKLHGGWTLVRMGKDDSGGKPNWLLIKEKDTDARPGDITRERPESVASGRDIEEIGSGKDRVWRSNRSESPRVAPPKRRARKRRLPEFVAPQLATLVSEAPRGEEWVHEIKLDGYRVLAATAGGEARLMTRKGLDWTDRFSAVAAAVAELPVESALLDGEVVALDADGRSSFQALQQAIGSDPDSLVFFVFDLLEHDGKDLRARPLTERKAVLAKLLPATSDTLRLSDHLAGQGDKFFAEACRLGVEGVVSKLARAPYRSGRSRDWLKTKCIARQEFVIGGFTDPQGTRSGLGALLVGVHEGKNLRYAGKVGTGFDRRSLAELMNRMRPLERKTPPFADPPRGAPARGAHWVEPRVVAEIAFTEWTADGLLRHPSFQGLRDDKPAAEVKRETPRRADAPAVSSSRRSAAKPARAKSAADEAAVAGVPLSNPGRVLFPEMGLTKLGLARYYEAVAERILPHIVDRPLTLVRCPQGRAKQCFYQKHLREDAPAALGRVEIREESGDKEPYVYVRDLEGIVSLVQLGVLELHGWGSRADDVERPDRLIFDLDPDSGLEWSAVVAAAQELRERLDAAGLRSWVQTTGGKGVHVIAPIVRRRSWNDVKPFCRAIAESMVADSPERYVSKASKAARRGKVFIDWLRNGRGATAIVPYSSRAREGATVATPIDWRELPKVSPADFDVATVPRRLVRRKDPWSEFFAVRQSLTTRGSRRSRTA